MRYEVLGGRQCMWKSKGVKCEEMCCVLCCCVWYVCVKYEACVDMCLCKGCGVCGGP